MPARLIPSEAGLREAAGLVRRGGVIAYPTETVYGLGCDPSNPEAVERIRTLKGRDAQKSFLLIVDGDADLSSYIDGMGSQAQRLGVRFWPGPLTLVFRAAPGWHSPCIGPGGTIAIRKTSDPVAAALCRGFGGPLVSTSANPSGLPPARSADEALGMFPEGLDGVVDGGERRSAAVSTVVDVTGDRPVVLRIGEVSEAEILAVLRNDARDPQAKNGTRIERI
jgi:L-threonylcarbamoyladenylate synthase